MIKHRTVSIRSDQFYLLTRSDQKRVGGRPKNKKSYHIRNSDFCRKTDQSKNHRNVLISLFDGKTVNDMAFAMDIFVVFKHIPREIFRLQPFRFEYVADILRKSDYHQ